MQLTNVKAVKLGDLTLTGSSFETDESSLREDAEAHNFRFFSPELDEEFFRLFAYRYLRFQLTTAEETSLFVELARFPIEYEGSDRYQALSCRVMPESGVISLMEMYYLRDMDQKILHDPFSTVLETSRGDVRVEIYFTPVTDLPELEPPFGYAKYRY